MNLVDVITGGLVFSLASTSSLHIYGSSLRWAQGHEQRQQLAADLDVALTAGVRQLWEQTDLTSMESRTEDCKRAAADLVDSLYKIPLEAGFTREVKQVGELVSFTVGVPGLSARRRWLSPAAYGLCGVPPLNRLPKSSPHIEEAGRS